MATHSSTLAWKIPWTEEPGRLQSMGSLSWARLRDFTFTFHFHALEKEMATHSSILAWKIPWTEESGRLHSPWGLKELDMNERLHFSHPYMTTGKTIALTIRTFVSKVMSLLF